MVNFDNEATIGTPAVDIERVIILEKRNNLFEALEDYQNKKFSGVQADLNFVRSRLRILFFEIQATLKRRLGKKEYPIFRDGILKAESEGEILKYIYAINEILDEMRLTRIDTKKVYDSLNIEAENKEKGY